MRMRMSTITMRKKTRNGYRRKRLQNRSDRWKKGRFRRRRGRRRKWRGGLGKNRAKKLAKITYHQSLFLQNS